MDTSLTPEACAELKAKFRVLRREMGNSAPELQVAADHVLHALHENDAYWKAEVDKLWRVIYALGAIAAFCIGWMFL